MSVIIVVLVYLWLASKNDAKFFVDVSYYFYSMLCKERKTEPNTEQFQDMVLTLMNHKHEQRMLKYGLKFER